MAVNADTAGELIGCESPAPDDHQQSGQAETTAEDPTPPTPDDDDASTGTDTDDSSQSTPRRVMKLAGTAGISAVVVLSAVSGWLGYQDFRSHAVAEKRALFLQVAKQGALNLTTIDWQRADADVQRILDSATGTFYDDFSKRSQPFVDVVKQTQSRTVGTITEAGLESETDDGAQVLVTLSVKTSNTAAPEQDRRAWRMRVTVQKVGSDVKVANVTFVP